MTVATYFASVKERLLTDPIVVRFSIVRERITDIDGHLRALVTLQDDSHLEFSEYVQVSPDGGINVVTYSYHWADTQGALIRHHIHEEPADAVRPSESASIFTVLDEIIQRLT